MIDRDGRLIERTPCKTETRTVLTPTKHGVVKTEHRIPREEKK